MKRLTPLSKAGPTSLFNRVFLVAQEVAHFIQYRPESEWAAQEFQLTVVPRDREWMGEALPKMKRFWDTWKENMEIPGIRDILVRKRAASLPREKKDATEQLAEHPCRIIVLDETEEASGMGENEIHKCPKVELVVGEEGESLASAII